MIEAKRICKNCHQKVGKEAVDQYGYCYSCASFGENFANVGNVLPEIIFSDKENEIIQEDFERHKALHNPELFKEVLKRHAAFQSRPKIIAFIKTITGVELTPFRLSQELADPKYKKIIDELRLRADGALGDIPIASLHHRMKKMNQLFHDADELEGAEKIGMKVRLLAEAHKMTHGSKITVDKKETRTLRVVLEKIGERNKALPERLGKDIGAMMKVPERELARA